MEVPLFGDGEIVSRKLNPFPVPNAESGVNFMKLISIKVDTKSLMVHLNY
jgi:hypothetical protein